MSYTAGYQGLPHATGEQHPDADHTYGYLGTPTVRSKATEESSESLAPQRAPRTPARLHVPPPRKKPWVPALTIVRVITVKLPIHVLREFPQYRWDLWSRGLLLPLVTMHTTRHSTANLWNRPPFSLVSVYLTRNGPTMLALLSPFWSSFSFHSVSRARMSRRSGKLRVALSVYPLRALMRALGS